MAIDDPLDPARTDGAAAPRSVTAFFDTREAADQARADLVAAGVTVDDIRAASGESTAAEPAHHHGFWDALKDFFVPDEDRHLYAEGLRRGGFALSVRTDAASYDRVVDVLDRDGAVDMDERAAGWRGEGWAAPDPAALGAREMAYAPGGDGTGGFAASRADQPLFGGLDDNAAVEPGSVVPDGIEAGRSTPDGAYAAAAPGLADTARESSPMPGTRQPAPALSSPARDTSHGRARVRSFIGADLSGGGLPRE